MNKPTIIIFANFANNISLGPIYFRSFLSLRVLRVKREFHKSKNLQFMSSFLKNKVKVNNEVNNNLPILIENNEISNENFDKEMKNFKIKTEFNNIIIPVHKLSRTKFLEILISNLKLRSINTIIMQISSYSENRNYMLGNQLGVKVPDNHNLNNYNELFDHFMEMYEILLDRYYLPKPEFFVIKIKTLIIDAKLRKDQFDNIQLPNALIDFETRKKRFNSNILPITYQEHLMGNLLIGEIRTNTLNELLFKMLEIEKGNKLNSKFYDIINILNKALNSEEYRLLLNFNKKHIILSKLNTNFVYHRWVFNNITKLFLFFSKDNLKLDSSYDFLYEYDKDIMWCRKITSSNFIFNQSKNNDVIALIQEIPLKAIEFKDLKEMKKEKSNKSNITNPTTINPNFGVFDIETFTDIDDTGVKYSRIYALGYMTYLDRKPNMFYLADHFNKEEVLDNNSSSKLLLKCIDQMLIKNYHNYIFYVHNLGQFDIHFLQKILLEYNLNEGIKYYLTPFYRDDNILRLSVSIVIKEGTKRGDKTIKINFVDSLNLLNSSLDKLAKDYNVTTKKDIFPYSFVNKNNLDYIGTTPDKSFFPLRVGEIDNNLYNSKLVTPTPWILRNETLLYLEKDLRALLEVLERFQKHLFIDHNIEMTESLTISSLAMKKYFKYYLKEHKIPLINNSNLFNFIYDAYFGGITEVYKPYGEDLLYLDVNSLYPSASLNHMPGTECKWIETFADIRGEEENGLDLDQLFGIFYAKVETKDLYFGLLPVRTKSGVIYPNGKFEGTWTSIELQFAKENGYKIKVIKGLQFNKSEGNFSEYVEELSNLKDKSKGSQRQIVKSLLNNLLGRFGLNFVKPVTRIVNEKELNYLISTRKVKTLKEINEDNFILTYTPLIDRHICEEHDIDYFKVVMNERKELWDNQISSFTDISLVTTAFINAYARIHMHKIKLKIISAGGLIFYSDTDSIVTNFNLVKLNDILPGVIGNKKGQLKLEHVISKGYFISNKLYALQKNDGTVIIKSKGVLTSSLSWLDFEIMYQKQETIQGERIYSKTDHKRGSVLIESKNINISPNSYTKRAKIFLNSIWIDTKPLYIDKLTKSLTIWKPKSIIKHTVRIPEYLIIYLPNKL